MTNRASKFTSETDVILRFLSPRVAIRVELRGWFRSRLCWKMVTPTELLRLGVLIRMHKQRREGFEQEGHVGLLEEDSVAITRAGFRV